MAVERHGDVQHSLERLDVLGDLVGHHGAGGVHDRDLVQTAVGQHFGLLGQLLGGQHVSLHDGVAALDAGGLDHADTVAGTRTVAGVGADAQELQAVFLRQGHVLLIDVFVAKEHADLRLVQIRLDQLQVLLVGARGNGVVGLVGAQPQAVAHFDGGNARVDHAFDHHLRQLGIEALADHVGAVAQCAVHNKHFYPFLSIKRWLL